MEDDDPFDGILDGVESPDDLDDEDIEAVRDEIEATIERIDSTIESLNRTKRELREKSDTLETFRLQRELFPADADELIEDFRDVASAMRSMDDSDGVASPVEDTAGEVDEER